MLEQLGAQVFISQRMFLKLRSYIQQNFWRRANKAVRYIKNDVLYSIKGQSSSYAVSYQLTGRELLTPDEVRLLDNKYALLFIRGERPIKDLKFDILKHKNTVFTPDGKGEPYVHKDTVELDAKDNFERYETNGNEVEVLSNDDF